jgi:hypothetical protein
VLNVVVALLVVIKLLVSVRTGGKTMTDTASRRIAIWIDQRQAILLAFEAGPFDGPVPHRPGDGWSQYRVDAQQHLVMQEYYDAVLSYLGPQDEILILGPGQAKRELRQDIEQHGNLKGKVVGLHEASRLGEVELVFPIGKVRHSEKAGPTQVDTLIPRPALGLPEGFRTLR